MNYEEYEAFMRAIEVANQVLELETVYPVPIKNIIKNDPEVELLTFKEFAKITGVNRFRVSDIGQSNEAFHFKKGSKSFIIYNELQYTKRVRFTLAHEYGHIKLNHMGKSIYDKNSANIEYSREEFEADTFAGALLFPLHMRYSYRGQSTYDLMNVFDLSFQAVRVCMRQFRQHMQLGLGNHLASQSHRLPDSYINFLREHSY
ncbi:ImmA/IrrE family metallo-endopeptidase [Staphylococcus cohnii]